MGVRAVLSLPAPDEPVEGWHVSALIDSSAYALGWLWVLVPTVLLGPVREDYLLWYLLTIAITDLHRHFGLPLVYLDADVRRRYPARFWLFPALLLIAWLASPTLDHSTAHISFTAVLAGLAALIVLVQVLRRDGGVIAAPMPTLLRVLGGSFGAALVVHVWTRSFGFEFDGGWWYFAAALFASTWLDLARSPAPPPAPPPAQVEQAIASTGGRRFATSMLILALIGAALLVDWIAPQPDVAVVHVLAAVGVFAALWNFWHVYMQKFGILRMYNAKARGRHGGAIAEISGAEVPAWADRALVMCWLPLYFAWLGPRYREIAVDYFDDAAALLPRFIDVLESAMPITVPLGIALVLLAHAAWLRAEWQANRLRSRPRLVMAAGTSGLALCFFVFDPVKVYLAFAFSHAIEYCVFVWAWQRKRYQAPLAHDPALGRLLRHPVMFYAGMVLVFGVALLLLKYWGRFIVPGAARPEVMGYRTAYWLGFWGVYQSLVHFYFDGFLWKMRSPSVRANI